MTEHARNLWGFGNPLSASLAGQQPALRTYRKMIVATDAMASSVSTFMYVAGPWPFTTDRWGVAYPAGLLLAVGNVGMYSGAGTINAQYEAFWQNEIQSLLGNCYALPPVLPVGYTACLQTPFFATNGFSYPGPPWGRFTKDGIADPLNWIPSSVPWGTTFSTGLYASDPAFNTNGTFELNSFLTPLTSVMGYRKCQLTFAANLPSTGSGGLTGGSLSYTISHNADGSIGASTGDLDTIDYSGTVTAAQLNAHGTNTFPGWTWQTDPIDIGALTPTLGKRCRFAIRVTSNSLVWSSGPSIPVTDYGASCNASMRCDIPFQCTITGEGGLIAPGGYVP